MFTVCAGDTAGLKALACHFYSRPWFLIINKGNLFSRGFENSYIASPNSTPLCPIVGRQHTSPAAPTTSTAALAQEGMWECISSPRHQGDQRAPSTMSPNSRPPSALPNQHAANEKPASLAITCINYLVFTLMNGVCYIVLEKFSPLKGPAEFPSLTYTSCIWAMCKSLWDSMSFFFSHVFILLCFYMTM